MDQIVFDEYDWTNCKAAMSAIPFLVELLKQPEVLDKHLILEFLARCVEGTGGSDYSQLDSLISPFRKPGVLPARAKEELDQPAGQTLRQNVGKHVELFLSFLAGGEELCRLHAGRLLILFQEAGEVILQALERIAATEPDDLLRSLHLLMRACLAPETPADFFQRAFETEPGELGKLMAAMCLVVRAKDKSPQQALDLISKIVLDCHDAIHKTWENLPGAKMLRWDGAFVLCSAISNLRAFDLASALRYAAASRSEEMDRQLLQMAFGSKCQDSRLWSPFQREAIKVVADHAWDQFGVTRLDFVQILRDFGLPDTPGSTTPSTA